MFGLCLGFILGKRDDLVSLFDAWCQEAMLLNEFSVLRTAGSVYRTITEKPVELAGGVAGRLFGFPSQQLVRLLLNKDQKNFDKTLVWIYYTPPKLLADIIPQTSKCTRHYDYHKTKREKA